MPTTETRRLDGDERMEAWVPLGAYAFDQTPPLPEPKEWERFAKYQRDPMHLFLFEDGKAVASAARSTMTQNVRGTLVPSGGIWGVAVHPGARRQGYARRLVVELLMGMRDEGAVTTTLYPFRESFYARLGYTIFPQPRLASFTPQVLLPLLTTTHQGEIELVAIKDGVEQWFDYLQQVQRRWHGFGLFEAEETIGINREDNGSWLALARVDGIITGMMTYQNKEDPRRMLVRSFYYDDPGTRYLLLEWFARHVDQIKEVEVRLAPAEHPETWFPDLNPQLKAGYPPMGRVLDVSRLGGIAVGPGDITARIRDEQCPWNDGTFRFVAVDGCLEVEAVSAAHADCELTIHGLSALIYGTHELASFGLRGWGHVPATAAADLTRMFPPLLPYLHSVF